MTGENTARCRAVSIAGPGPNLLFVAAVALALVAGTALAQDQPYMTQSGTTSQTVHVTAEQVQEDIRNHANNKYMFNHLPADPKALERMKEAGERYRENREFVMRGDALAARGDFDGAIATYHAALDFKPAYAAREAHIGLADVFAKKGRYADALAQYSLVSPEKSLSQNFFGGNSEVELKYVLVLCRLGKFDEARRAYRMTLLTHPDILKGITFVPLDISVTDINYTTRQLETAALLALGIEYFWHADSVQASSRFKEAIRLKPRFAASYFFLGMALGDSYPVSASPAVQAKAESDRRAAFEKAASLGDSFIQMRSEQELGKRPRMTTAEYRAFDARLRGRLPGMMEQVQAKTTAL